MKRIFTAGMLVPILCACLGCGHIEHKRIKQELESRAAALQESDHAAYLDFFAGDYRCEWADSKELFGKAVKNLSKETPPAVSFQNPDIIIKGEKALVTETFQLEDKFKGKPRRYAEIQHLRMRKRDDRWVCVQGSRVLELLGGRMEEEAAIEKALLEREAALVKRDINSYMDLVSKDYSFQGEGVGDVKNKVMRNFRIYDNMNFRSYDRKIWFFGNYATVQQRFTIDAERLGEPMTVSGKERFEMKKTKEGWKIIKGL